MIDQPHWRRLLLRSEEAAKRYEDTIRSHPNDGGCNLCNDAESIIKSFEHWTLMKNKFPYDRYFTKSDMLVLKRHIGEKSLNEEERMELVDIKSILSNDYDSLIEHLPKQKSIPDHHHLHVIEYKRPA